MANIQFPPASSTPWRSHTITPVCVSARSSAGVLYGGPPLDTLFILTSASITASSSAEGNACGLEVVTSLGDHVAFLGGMTGAGQFDNFHFSGELALSHGWGIYVDPVGGQWDVVCSGYLTGHVVG
jgi:hypothetical protein